MAQDTIVHAFWERAANNSDKDAIMYKHDGAYKSVKWKEHAEIVRRLAGGFLALGVKAGEHVAILGQSRPHWTWADIACLSVGGATIPIYATLAGPEVHYLVSHSDSVGVVVENDRQARKIFEGDEPLNALKFIVVMEGPVPDDLKIACFTWDDLLKKGDEYLKDNDAELKNRIAAVEPDQMASIVYTSGTTGVPKGVILSHRNFYSVCEAVADQVKFDHNDTALSFLPLSHVYERVGGQMLAIYSGCVIAYAESIEMVPRNIQEVKPTILNGVPRFYEKAYQRIQAEIKNMPKPQQYLIRWSFSLKRRAAKYDATGGKNDRLGSQFAKGELRVADRLVFSKIRKRFGGRLRMMVSGAAPLSEEVQTFFETIGLTIIEGYGLTETSAPIACNRPFDNKFGTVGRCLPGLDVKIAADGEILIKGPSIFSGYYKNDEATKEAFDDGWFCTGDIGEIDADGYIRIKDRKKDIIITSGGKHIAPQFIENMYKGEGLISNVLAYGDRRKYVVALFTINRDGLKQFALAHGLPTNNLDELTVSTQIRNEVEALVNRKNEHLASFEHIKKFIVLPGDFTAEANEVTPTFKLKRKIIIEHYKDVLDSMYDAADVDVSAKVQPA